MLVASGGSPGSRRRNSRRCPYYRDHRPMFGGRRPIDLRCRDSQATTGGTCAVLLGLLAGPALAGPDTDLGHAQRTAQLESTPLDVTTLAERDVECRRWLATVISDAATDYRVERALTRLRCDALATDRAALRHKYAQSPRVLQSIDVGP